MSKINFLSLLSGCGGLDLGLEKAGMKCQGQVEKMKYALKVLNKHWRNVPKYTDIYSFCVQDGLVKIIQMQVQEKVSKVKKVIFGKKWQEYFNYLNQNGLLEKMFPGFSPLMTEKTFKKFYQTSWKSGMAFRGEYLIVNISECPNIVVESSLLDILENPVHPKYYLSRKAITGIIRRAWRHGRKAYVLLREMGKDKTAQVKRLSVRQLEPKNLEKEPKVTLRKLTPNEKEALQGFPKDWTFIEE